MYKRSKNTPCRRKWQGEACVNVMYIMNGF